MAPRRPAPAATRHRPGTVLVVLVLASAAVVGVFVERSAGTSDDGTAAPPAGSITTPLQDGPGGAGPPGPPDRLPRAQQGGLGVADGVVPDGATVFDDEYPAVARLDPDLRAALDEAARDAARVGVTFYVDSGWRSPAYQEQLLRQAIAKYGSAAEAARWVATPETSAHVSGDAVDIGHASATAWLSRHGAGYGLCQIYRNEAWHYEVRPDAAAHGCPPMYADPTHDPRMRP
jgi:hypothetical protein